MKVGVKKWGGDVENEISLTSTGVSREKPQGVGLFSTYFFQPSNKKKAPPPGAFREFVD